jgi:hypothetical protein
MNAEILLFATLTPQRDKGTPPILAQVQTSPDKQADVDRKKHVTRLHKARSTE